MTRIATYRLSRHLPSFEFFYWLVMVQADGAEKIIFDISRPKTRKFTYDSVMRRFHSILEPGPAFAGLPSRIGTELGYDAVPRDLIPWVRSGRTFKRLATVKPPVKCKYTVTIRQNIEGARGRDSNADNWRDFAKEIDATLVEDWFDDPIHLHDRMALYAGAEMNFGVCNGPMALLSLTEYPVAMFVNTQSAYNSTTRWGIQEGQKNPWMLPNQHMLWLSDKDPDNLRRGMEMVV